MKAVMYGAGNIGRGFIGQLFSVSGYETIFIDINSEIIDKINRDKKYPVYTANKNEYEISIVENIAAVNGNNTEKVAEQIADADIMATAVGVNVLTHISDTVASGIKRRMKTGNRAPLNIIICENMISADTYFKNLLAEKMNNEEKEYLDKNIGLVQSSVGRMVPVTPKEIADKNILAVCVEKYCELPVDKNAFKGKIPDIKNMMPYSPFEYLIYRKLYMHNMSHSFISYLGYLKGYEYIWQAACDSQIQLLALRALLESAQVLSKAYNIPFTELLAHAENLLYRFTNRLLADTVARVGKDTIRKLSAKDRLTGLYNLALKNQTTAYYAELGIAAALLFNPQTDKESTEVFEYTEKHGVGKALNKYCGIADSLCVQRIESLYKRLKTERDLGDIITDIQDPAYWQ